MLAIQADEHGNPVVIESVTAWNGKQTFQEVTADRWAEIVAEGLEIQETNRPIIPIQAIAAIEFARDFQ